MEKYYKGGYYLMKTKLMQSGPDKDKVARTCSSCINLLAFDLWCLSWMRNDLTDEEKYQLNLTDEKIEAIHQWTDGRFAFGSNVLPDLETAIEFKNLFFKSREDIEIYCLNFPETDVNFLISEFGPPDGNQDAAPGSWWELELRKNLLRKIEETDNANEELVGYDFIGLENSGFFHSFYCHHITDLLISKFSLRLNDFGLFDEPEDSNSIREYLNGGGAKVEEVPWYIVKVQRINIDRG